ncbi:MAG: stage 0 sporulation family protein [Clostridiales bacterium]|nr:stage 0 sporulation family protein [Clostridiales bacterium]
MPKVIGVRFRTSPRMYYFAPTEGEEYKKGTKIVVETQRGVELATVVLPVTEVEENKIVAPLKGVMRIATESDIEAASADEAQKQEIIATAKQKVAARGLDMKIVDCEFTVDHSKLVLYFTAEQRVDFRELVRDLASAFHMRIDLRQIGAREECKLIGSLGACGMPCCCGRFESDSEHVSIKMAKCQNLALTPNKINGMCGRLLCCLSYENKTYEDVARRSPKVGSWLTCPDGRRGSVVSVTPLTEKVRLRVGDEDNFEFVEYTLDELKTDGNRGGNDRDRTGTDMEGLEPPPDSRDRQRNNNQNVNNNGGKKKNKNKNGQGDRPDKNGQDRSERIKNNSNNNNGNRNNNNQNGNNNNGGNGGGKKKKHKFNRNKQGGGAQNGAKPQGGSNPPQS